MVATFIVEEVTQAGRKLAGGISKGLKKAQPFIGGPKVAGGLDRMQNGTINLGIRVTRFSVPRLLNFWSYAKVELRPPRISEISEASKGLQDLKAAYRAGKWKEVTVKDAAVNAAVVVEVMLWFFIGEILGKGTVIGYQYPGAVHMQVEL